MKIVNPHAIVELLNGLVGMADDDEYVLKYRDLDPENEERMKDVIRAELVPEFLQLPAAGQEFAKLSLRYYLTVGGIDWARIFSSSLMPFPPPTHPRDFFIWIWEILYPAEAFMIENRAEFVEDFALDGWLKYVYGAS